MTALLVTRGATAGSFALTRRHAPTHWQARPLSAKRSTEWAQVKILVGRIWSPSRHLGLLLINSFEFAPSIPGPAEPRMTRGRELGMCTTVPQCGNLLVRVRLGLPVLAGPRAPLAAGPGGRHY